MKRKGTSFKSYASGVLERVQVLNLDWAKALPFGEGTLGGWVSDNCLAWVRLYRLDKARPPMVVLHKPCSC
jgi:hypothetical protein